MAKDNQNVKRQNFEIRQIDAMKKAHEMELRALKERHDRQLKMLTRRLKSGQVRNENDEVKMRDKPSRMIN